jgi:hypothetical protein
MSKQHKQRFHSFLALSLALTLVLVLAGSALAVDVRGGDTVTVGKDEVIDDDLAVAGNTIIVDGVINGDLVAAGANVIVNGKVNGSLMMAGRTLELNGQVGGTVYSAGAALTVGTHAVVARSLFFAGYSYTAEPGSAIDRDNIVAGYQGVFNGEVKRNLQGYLTALELNGTVAGNVDAFVERPGTVADTQFWPYFGRQELPPALIPGLRVGPEAKIGGQFRYTSPVEQTRAIAAKPEGGIVYRAPEPGQPGTRAVTALPTPREEMMAWVWARLREVVSLTLLGGLALWLLPALFQRVAERTQVQPWLAAAWGLLVGIVGYGGALLAAILIILLVAGLAALTLAGLAVSVFGLGFSALGLALSLFLLLGAYASKLVVIYPLSHTLLEKFLPQWNHYKIVPLFLGVLVFVLLRSIPWLGALLGIIVTLIGLGAMWLAFRDRFTKAVAPKLVLAPA